MFKQMHLKGIISLSNESSHAHVVSTSSARLLAQVSSFLDPGESNKIEKFTIITILN